MDYTEVKKEKQIVNFTKNKQSQISAIRKAINGQQESYALYNYLLILIGLANVTTAIGSAMVGTIANGNLESLEDFYTLVEETLGDETNQYTVAEVTQEWEGTWKGNNKGWVYNAKMPTVRYSKY